MRLSDAVALACSVTSLQTAVQVLATPDLNLRNFPHYFLIYFFVADSVRTKNGTYISRETQYNSEIRLQVSG
jgi:hypothetical protein